MVQEDCVEPARRDHNRLGLWVPANALGHAHIFEAPSSGGGVEVFEAVLHGDGARRFGRWVAVPAAEPADDPGGPGKAVRWMRISEPFALGFEIAIEGGERRDFVSIEGNPDGLTVTAITGLHELKSDDRRFGRDHNQLKKALGGSDLAVFEPEALRLENAEELLDQPAPFVPFDDAPGLFCSRHRMRREQPPVQRLDAGVRVGLPDIDQG